MSPRKLKTDPEIVEMPNRTMAVVHTVGDPNELGETVFKALYGAVYPLKFTLKKQGVDFQVEPPRARWFGGEGWKDVPRDEWEAAWALPVPDGTTELAQKLPGTAVVLETWEYGCVAQILHIGPFSAEGPTIERLHDFIDARTGRTGKHHEIYLSDIRRGDPKKWKTIIRQPMK